MAVFKLHKKQKSQAALEFLTTYGWTFLVILIMIGTLNYFDILSPSKLLPERCNFGAEIGCEDFATFRNGVNLRVKNNVGMPIVIEKITASNENLECTSPTVNRIVKSDEINDFYYVCDISGYGFPENEKIKLNLEINYHLASSSDSFSKKVEGEIYSTVHGSLYDQIDPSSQAYPAINTASQMIDAVNAYKRDMGFYPLDVGRGNDPGLASQFPINPETGELLNPAGSRCNPGNWRYMVELRWRGAYMNAWPDNTPWGGEYDYNLWPDGASRYGQSVPPGIYLGIQKSRSDAAETAIPADVETDLVARGIDADGGVNGESQLFLSSITCEVPESNPNVVGTWHFDEGSGTTATDSSTYGNNGNIFNGPVWVAGKKGNALSFDGVDDFIEIQDSASLDITSQITIMAWVKVNVLTGNADQDMILNKEGIPYEIAVHDNTGPDDGTHSCGKSTDQIAPFNFAFYINGLSGLPDHNCGWKDGGGPIPQNIWTHVAITYDGSAVRTYINGIIKKEYIGISGTIQTNDNAVRIGGRGTLNPPPQTNGGALFNGVIDEVKIYNIALSPEQIMADYSG